MLVIRDTLTAVYFIAILLVSHPVGWGVIGGVALVVWVVGDAVGVW